MSAWRGAACLVAAPLALLLGTPPVEAQDRTPPSLTGAAVKDNTLTLTYNEALNETEVPGTGLYEVRVEAAHRGPPAFGHPMPGLPVISLPGTSPVGERRAVSRVVVSGKAVTLTLTPPVVRDETVRVSYLNAAFSSTSTRLRDLAGNLAWPLTSRAVANTTTNRAPVYRGPSLGSATLSPDSTIHFSVPKSRFNDPDGDALTFSVSASHHDVFAALAYQADERVHARTKAACVLVHLTPPPSATVITVTASDPAGLFAQARRTFLVSYACPVLSSAVALDDVLTLTYDSLPARWSPAGGEFTVKVDRSAVSLAATNPVSVSGNTVTLTLAAPVGRNQSVTVSHAPGADPKTTGFTDRAVRVDSTSNSPVLSSAVALDDVLTLTYDSLPAGWSPAAGEFTVKVDRSAVSLAATNPVSVSGSTVTLTLAAPVGRNQSVTVSHAPGTVPRTTGFTDRAVRVDSTNNAPVPIGTRSPSRGWLPGPAPRPGATVAERAHPGTFINAAAFSDPDGDAPALSLATDGGFGAVTATSVGSRVYLRTKTACEMRRLTPAPPRRFETVVRVTASDPAGAATGLTIAATTQWDPGWCPLVTRAVVNGVTLTLTFDQEMHPSYVPRASAFDLRVNGSTVALAATEPVAVSGKTVVLSLAAPVASGNAVTLSFTADFWDEIRSLRGAAAEDFSNLRVINLLGEPTALAQEVIWSATLTVASVGGVLLGCMPVLKYCRNRLTDDSFTYGGVTYQVRGAYVQRSSSGRRLRLGLDKAIPQDLTLRVGDRRFPVADATLSTSNALAIWNNSGLAWTSGQKVSLSLTAPAGGSGGAGGDAEGESASVTGMAVGSSAGADATYGHGDTIHVRVAFSETVDVTGSPRLKIDMDPAAWGEKWASYESGSGTSSLTFAHTVVQPNISTQGIAVLENTLELNGGTIRSGRADAALAHTGLPHDANHKVDWRTPPEGGTSGSGGVNEDSANSGPPTVAHVAVVSDPGTDDTYLLGDTIRIRATFSEAVTVTGSPGLSIDMDPAAWGTKRAAYESGGGTSSLTFAHTVVEPNYSTQGIAVLANSLALNGGTIRSAATSANAALAHARLGHDAGHKVDWRPAVSVADARANEGAGASAVFRVSLSRAFATPGHRVTVDYATSDGTAVAGEDYTETSGTLTFAAGESVKTVSVPVMDDALDEGQETFTLRLSDATGARIGDGEATGTIANDDPLQKVWLSRFGRTVASHVTDAVADRLAGPLAGAELLVGGQRVDLARAKDEAWLGETMTSLARALGAREEPAPGGGWPGIGFGDRESPALAGSAARKQSGRELLLGSAFHLGAEGEGGGPGLAAWGQVTAGGFDGEAPADGGTMRIDGDVTTGVLGADAEWDRLLAGVAVSVSDGEGTFAQPGVDSGTIEGTMTTVSPYARLRLSERVSAWGLLGFGTGDMTMTQAANERGQPERVTRTDLETRLAAVGGRGALLEAGETGGMDLALKADAFFVETESEAVSNEGSTAADASRVRLVLEGGRAFETGAGSVLTPGLELALRHDGGDAETGTGVEVGGRIAWSDPGTGFSVEARARTLVAHEASDYEKWGASGAVRLDPGAAGRGLSFRLAPTWGAASSGAERLWSARDARGFGSGVELDPESRLEGELGYGLAAFGGRFTGTPQLSLGLSERAREVRIGWRLTPAAGGEPGFELNLDATRREASSGVEPPEHSVMLRGALRW